jgi:hypothetical protein
LSAYHKRNPIKRHGGSPDEHFAQIPNEVIRDGSVSDAGYRLLSVIYSHADGYEVSIASLASELGRDRKNTGRALRAVAESRWLAIQHIETAEGKRAYETYHVHSSRKLTEAEWLKYSATVTLGQNASPPCGNMPYPPEAKSLTPMGQFAATKKTNLEHQVEEQEEDQSIYQSSFTTTDLGADDAHCQHCEDSPVNVCGMHFHERKHRYREPDESDQDKDVQPGPRPSMPNTLGGNIGCGIEGCDQRPLSTGEYCPKHVLVRPRMAMASV